MDGMKYLVFQLKGSLDTERVYLFSKEEKHADFAARNKDEWWVPIRGGFAYIIDGSIKCYGEAFSLSLRGDKEKDEALLRKQLVME